MVDGDPSSARSIEELSVLIDRGLSLFDAYSDPDLVRQAARRFAAAQPSTGFAPQQAGPGRRPALPGDGGRSGRPPKVCIATPDIVGPVRNGGIGTAYTSLALCLADAGHDVTILYTLGDRCEKGTLDDWVHYYRQRRIRFVPLPCSPHRPPRFIGPEVPHESYVWLRQQSFDVIHFPEWNGTGFFAVQARRLGLAFARTTLCVGVHSPTLWHDLEDRRCIERVDQLAVDALERRCVELADVVVAPSQYLLSWLDLWGWRTPAKTYVWPYVRPLLSCARPPGSEHPDEIVFFGRLESRKGLELFCNAVDLLAGGERLAGKTVSFLGKNGLVAGRDGLSYVRERASAWSCRWQVMADRSQGEALEYLSSRNALAIMPSLADNTPNTVLECMVAGVPFLTTAVGGIPEMIAEADREAALVAPHPAALAAGLERALAAPARPVHPAVDDDTVRRTWIAWHESQVPGFETHASQQELPRTSVSVCIATRNRPSMLRQALDSLSSQTCLGRGPELEVIVVDDGSDLPEARQELDTLKQELAQRGWRLLREPQRYPGAARNTAAAHARGRYLLFMDDDNLALPEEVETFLRVAERTGAAILTCGMDAFAGDRPDTDALVHRWFPIGTALPLGALVNCFGDTNMFIRRETFFRAGSFDEEAGAGLVEDWIFFSRAALKGIEIAVVPEVLFHYRLGPHAHGQSVPAHVNYLRSLRPYLQALPSEIGLALAYAAGVSRRLEPAQGGSDLVARVLQRRFEQADTIFRLEPADAGGIDPLQELRVKRRSRGILLRATGSHPQCLLPTPHLQLRSPVVVRAELSSPARTVLRLFWACGESPGYREDWHAEAWLEPGHNEVFLEVPAGGLVWPLRLDPGGMRGDYLLHSFELRGDGAEAAGAEHLPRQLFRHRQGRLSPRVLLQRLARWAGSWLTRQSPPATRSGSSREDQRQRFAAAEPLLRIGPEDVSLLTPVHQLEVAQAAGGLLLRSHGNDPHARLPRCRWPRGHTLLVRIRITSPVATDLQVFWRTLRTPLYSETSSLRVDVTQGSNELLLEIPGRGFGALRLDPASVPGELLLREIEIRAERRRS